jgi:hypothetical protein
VLTYPLNTQPCLLQNLLNASATDGRGVPMHKMVGTFITACNPFHCFVGTVLVLEQAYRILEDAWDS